MKLDANGCLKPSCDSIDSIVRRFPYMTSPPPQTSSIEETTQAVDIQVYPNPATSEITIAIAEQGLSNLHLKIFNPLGQLMLSKAGIEAQQKVDIAHLHPGLYHFSILDERQRVLKSGAFMRAE